MATVVIPESDAQTFKSLQNGESVEAQAIVTESGEKDFRKGDAVTVSFVGSVTQATIVSDPTVINDDYERGKKTLSLVLESQMPK